MGDLIMAGNNNDGGAALFKLPVRAGEISAEQEKISIEQINIGNRKSLKGGEEYCLKFALANKGKSKTAPLMVLAAVVNPVAGFSFIRGSDRPYLLFPIEIYKKDTVSIYYKMEVPSTSDKVGIRIHVFSEENLVKDTVVNLKNVEGAFDQNNDDQFEKRFAEQSPPTKQLDEKIIIEYCKTPTNNPIIELSFQIHLDSKASSPKTKSMFGFFCQR